MYPEAKSFTDRNGKKGKAGSLVKIYDTYENRETDIVLPVIKAHKQGSDGTILHFDSPPMPQHSIYHKQHRAKDVVIVG